MQTAAGIPSIHPFPARMAPDLALRQLDHLTPGSLVLDPMVGSGTVLRCAAEHGHRGIGFDIDPLAVLMSRVWTTPLDVRLLRERGAEVIVSAVCRNAEADLQRFPTPESAAFLRYWFGHGQRSDLARLAAVLDGEYGPVGDALRLALSRIIITKDRGASLARDVSHSRPHKVLAASNYDVIRGFARSVEQLASRLARHPPRGNVDVQEGDARELPLVDGCVDAVVTSPPYLNAIDYFRGHRLALAWMGFDLSHLRSLRSTSIGTERGLERDKEHSLAEALVSRVGHVEALPPRQFRMVLRYALDMLAVMRETIRVLRPNSTATVVVGNSSIRGVFLANDAVVTAAAGAVGLELFTRLERQLPAARRYLPPPEVRRKSHLSHRMRSEVVLKFRKA